jgi:hypothetical protein
MSREQKSNGVDEENAEAFSKDDFVPNNVKLPVAVRAKLAARAWRAPFHKLTEQERKTKFGYKKPRSRVAKER